MAWFPIANIVPQYTDPDTAKPFSGAVLKAYKVNTLTNIPFATDNTGNTTVNSVALNASGNPEVSGNVVIPHLDQDYKLALYPDQTAADADSGALWTVDNLDLMGFDSGAIDPEHATDSATDAYVSATNTTPPADGVKITRDFQSANTTTTPTLDGKTMTTRDGSALWAGAVSGPHTLQRDQTADTYLLLYPIGTDANVNNAPVSRDANGRAKFTDPSAAQDAVTYGVLGAEAISTGSFSGASVDISLTSDYPSHILVIGDLQPETDATDLRSRVSADGGSTFDSGASDYQKQAFEVDGGSTSQGRASEDHAELTDDMSNAAAEITSGVIFISNARNSGARTMFFTQFTQVNSAGNMVIRTHVAERISDQVDDTIRLFLGSGNFSQGNYQLYGMR